MKKTIPPHTIKSGFTLIELLVVIAIIALLAAILFPVFGRARENARRSSCQSNLKQIGLGVMQYTQDYDEFLPMRETLNVIPNGATFERATWRNRIFPYVKSEQIFSCPSNPRNNRLASYEDIAGQPQITVSYAAARSGGNGAFDNTAPVKLSVFDFPATTLFVVESTSRWTEYDVGAGSGTYDQPTATGNSNNGALFSGHLGTSNFLFVDGHVKSLGPLATMAPPAGSGSVNMWWRSNANPGSSGRAAMVNNLSASVNHWN